MAECDESEQVQSESSACWELRQIIRDAPFPLKDQNDAAEELERLAEQSDLHAQYLMGLLYRDGLLLIPDSQSAKYWLTQAAKQGLPEAQYALDNDLEVCDSDGGIRCLKEAAGNGNHFAAYRLGKKYLSGEVVSKDAVRVTERLT